MSRGRKGTPPLRLVHSFSIGIHTSKLQRKAELIATSMEANRQAVYVKPTETQMDLVFEFSVT